MRLPFARLFKRLRPDADPPFQPAVPSLGYHDLFGKESGSPPKVPLPDADLPPASPNVAAARPGPVPSGRQTVSVWRQKLKDIREDIEQGRAAETSPKLDGVVDAMDMLSKNDLHCAALAALVLTGRLKAASGSVNRMLNTPGWLDFRFHAGPARHPSEILWSIAADGGSTISINTHLKTTKQAFVVLEKRLFPLLPIIGACHARADKAASSVVLHVGDDALSPGIGFCTNRNDVFLIADSIFLHQRGYETIRAALRDNPVAWRDRAAFCYWRGGNAGMRTDQKTGWRSFPRVKLCEIGRHHPDKLDFGITHIAQMTDEEASEIKASGLMKPYAPASGFIDFRYHVDIDGNTNSWPGLFQKLLTGSLVLKIDSPGFYRQWFYDRLKPWDNFVPVASDLSDLVEKVEWARTHDDQAREIGARGKALADSLDFEGEIQKSAETAAAAFRHFARRPAG